MPENKKIVLEPAAQKFADDNAKPLSFLTSVLKRAGKRWIPFSPVK